jgi:hypothetical protein
MGSSMRTVVQCLVALLLFAHPVASILRNATLDSSENDDLTATFTGSYTLRPLFPSDRLSRIRCLYIRGTFSPYLWSTNSSQPVSRH